MYPAAANSPRRPNCMVRHCIRLAQSLPESANTELRMECQPSPRQASSSIVARSTITSQVAEFALETGDAKRCQAGSAGGVHLKLALLFPCILPACPECLHLCP